MQILFLSRIPAILLCIALWLLFQLSAAVVCMYVPDRFFDPDSFFYRTRHWEKGGSVYKKLFKVNRWKKYLPDGGSCFKRGYQKKYVDDFSKEGMNRFLVESCRAEMSHWLAILPFWIFGLFAPPVVIPIMLAYAIAINMPCIITQRYNRPRIMRFLSKIQ